MFEKLTSRHCEERSDEAIHSFFAQRDGLLRCARNDDLQSDIARNDGVGTRAALSAVIARPGDRVFRGVSDGTEKPRRTGYPASAGYDDG
jgi:hypothetical protein